MFRDKFPDLDGAGGVVLHLDAAGDGLVLRLHQLHHVTRVRRQLPYKLKYM